jgi:hypothetical protein
LYQTSNDYYEFLWMFGLYLFEKTMKLSLIIPFFLLPACEGAVFTSTDPAGPAVCNYNFASERLCQQDAEVARVDSGNPHLSAMVAPEAGAPETSMPEASTPVCLTDLSNTGAGDFSISFTLSTTMVGVSAILNQRQICAGSDFWDIQAAFPSPTQSNQPNGAFGTSMFGIGMETDDTQNYTDLVAPVILNDGVAHSIQFLRLSGNLSVVVDGKTIVAKPSLSVFNMLSPLAQGKDVCDSVDGTLPFTSGSITNLCLQKL